MFVYIQYVKKKKKKEEDCFQSGPRGRPPIGEWATLYKYQKKEEKKGVNK